MNPTILTRIGAIIAGIVLAGTLVFFLRGGKGVRTDAIVPPPVEVRSETSAPVDPNRQNSEIDLFSGQLAHSALATFSQSERRIGVTGGQFSPRTSQRVPVRDTRFLTEADPCVESADTPKGTFPAHKLGLIEQNARDSLSKDIQIGAIEWRASEKCLFMPELNRHVRAIVMTGTGKINAIKYAYQLTYIRTASARIFANFKMETDYKTHFSKNSVALYFRKNDSNYRTTIEKFDFVEKSCCKYETVVTTSADVITKMSEISAADWLDIDVLYDGKIYTLTVELIAPKSFAAL